MAGVFTPSSYELDSGTIVSIRVQPETIAADLGGGTNDPPSGAKTAGWPSAKVSGGKRQIGINARSVNLSFGATVPSGYRPYSSISIPVLTKALWDSLSSGDACTYLGTACTVAGKSPEVIK